MLLTNALILTLDDQKPILEKGAIHTRQGIIDEIGNSAELLLQYPKEKILDAEGKWVIPGLINSHTHLYSGLARGLTLKDPPPANFLHILQRIWWRLDKALDKESIYYSAMVELMDCIRHGTTTLIDHHASPNASTGSLDILEKAIHETGIRACLCYEVSDRDGKKKSQEGMDENIRYIQKIKRSNSKQIAALFGLHASFTLSDKTLKKAGELANQSGVGCHIHVCEDLLDLQDAKKKGYRSVIDRLNQFHILGNQTLLAHCIHLEKKDFIKIKETGSTIIHNPHSNLNNAVGLAPISQFIKKGITVGLGSDGWTDGMFNEIRLSILLPRLKTGNPQLGFQEAYGMAFENNAFIAGKLFHQKIGKIREGEVADFILMDYIPPTPVTKTNWMSHLIYGLSQSRVDTVISSGKTLFKNGEFTTLDEKEILTKATESAKKLWKRF